MRLADVNVFPARIKNWETLNDLARTFIQIGATKPTHTIEVKQLIGKLPGSPQNAYRILREAVGFAPIRDHATGTLAYYFEANELRELMGEDIGVDFYPKSFTKVRGITGGLKSKDPDLIIDREGQLVQIALGPEHIVGLKLNEEVDKLFAAREIGNPEEFLMRLRNIARLTLTNLYAQKGE